MSELTRGLLKDRLFHDGARPSAADFADLIDSFIHKSEDGVSLDSNGDLVLKQGVQLGDSNGTAAGGLRFNSNQLQVFTNGAWTNVSGGGGAFQQVAATPGAVAHNGNVGIGTGANPLTFRLEVELAANTGTLQQVRFGNVVCANGSQANSGAAVFSHKNHASNTNFALRQGASGAVQINAAAGQAISVSQAGGQVNFGVSASGKVIVGDDNDLIDDANNVVLHILQVSGDAYKSVGGGAWKNTSDARIKEEVRDLDLGLLELRRIRPVRFRYNGRAGTNAGEAGVGVLGQEIETVLPETIQRVNVPDDPELNDMRVFDASALTFVLINAVKELAERVEILEESLAAATAAASAAPANR